MQVYYGNGKGKTTAAMGLAVRALGGGKRVYIGQFIKDMAYGEISVIRNLPGAVTELYGSGQGCIIGRAANEKDYASAARGYEKAKAALISQDYDLVILDEINVACVLKLLTVQQLLDLMDMRPVTTELVFTGRGCPQAVLNLADLITEMREVRHYYHTKGLLARDGIER